MIFIKHFAAAIAFAYFPTGSSQTITVTISQQANGVQFAFAGKLDVLPAGRSGSGVDLWNFANKVVLYNTGGAFQHLVLYSSTAMKKYKIGSSSTADLSCNTFPAGVDKIDHFDFSPSLTANSAFGMRNAYTLFAPSTYTANTVVSTIELIGGQTLANVGFNSGTNLARHCMLH